MGSWVLQIHQAHFQNFPLNSKQVRNKNPFLPSQLVRLDYTCKCLDWATYPSKSRPILGIRPSITFGPKRDDAWLIGLYCCGPLLSATNSPPKKELLILTVQQLHSVYDLCNSPSSTKSIIVLGLWAMDQLNLVVLLGKYFLPHLMLLITCHTK